MTGRPLLVISDGADDDLRALTLLDAADGITLKALVATSGSQWMSEARRRLEALALGPVHDGLPEQVHAERASITAASPAAYRGAFDRPRPAPRTTVSHQPLPNAQPPTVLLLGPATVLAHWLDAGLKDRIGPVFVFAGALEVPGNATARAEFNAWFDPAALDTVLAAGLDLTLLPLDALGNLAWDRAWLDEFSKLHTPLAAGLRASLDAKVAVRPRLPLWDEALVLALIAPEVVTRSESRALAVDAEGALIAATDGRKPVTVITGLDLAACRVAVHRLCADSV